MVLYVFNPDTDLALANGDGNYTPTSSVRQMIQDLSVLPMWYAEPGSRVLAEGTYNEEFLSEMKGLFHREVSLISPKDLRFVDEPVMVSPWGWNRSFRNMLGRAGVDMASLPSDIELDERRQLSQRKVVGQVLDLFRNESGFCGVSRNLIKTTDCEKHFNSLKHSGGVVFKEPWSSSGKGLLWCRAAFSQKDRNWCHRVINSQGYVTMMPIYNKLQDFAMEFYIDDDSNHATFIGYSLFDTDIRGSYRGNTLLDNQEIEDHLSEYVPYENLQKTKLWVGPFLSQVGYRAYVGVDMMICEEVGGMCIHPCVEINYRATMGYLARVLKDNYLTQEAHGRFKVQHFHSHDELATFVVERKQNNPLVIREGRVHSGFMPLVPVTPNTQNLAYIDVY